MQEGKLRIVSGLILAAICIIAALSPSLIQLLLIGIIMVMCSYELSKLLQSQSETHSFMVILINGVWMLIFALGFKLHLTALVSLLGLILIILLYTNPNRYSVLQKSFLKYAYIGLFLGALFGLIFDQGDSNLYLLCLLSLIWMSDVGAYYSGKLFGKRKLYEAVSPNKTLEGFIGGGLTVILVAILWSYFTAIVQLPQALILGIIVWLAATAGDLIESSIKRSAGVKDSGNIIPGHGGFFDRFDAFIFASPFFALCIYLF